MTNRNIFQLEQTVPSDQSLL